MKLFARLVLYLFLTSIIGYGKSILSSKGPVSQFLDTSEFLAKDKEDSTLFALKAIVSNNSYNSNTIGQAYYRAARILGKNHQQDTSILLLKKAIPLFKNNGDSTWLANVAYELSFNYLILGLYEQSLAQIQRATEFYRAGKIRKKIALSLAWTSIIYHDIGDYKNGIVYGKKAFEQAHKLNSITSDVAIQCLNAIAINFDDWGKYDSAIAYHKKAILLRKNLSDTTQIARSYNNIGNSLMKKGAYKQANFYFNKNLLINQALNDEYALATVYTNLGTVAYKKGDFIKADHLLRRAEKLALKINDIEKIQDVFYQQYLLNKIAHDYHKSLRYFEKYTNLKDSLLSIEKVKSLQELETRYQTNQKQQLLVEKEATIKLQKARLLRNTFLIISIVLLTIAVIIIGLLQRNRLIKKHLLKIQAIELKNRTTQLEAVIDSQEKERQRFASDLHDGFGQMISILKMNLDALRVIDNGETDIDKRAQILVQSTTMLNEMYDELRAICFNLMPQTLLREGLLATVKELASRINVSSAVDVEVTGSGFAIRLETQQEILLYRIIQEWVNNILKYSNASKVVINLTKEKEDITLIIEDDGTGFDTALLTRSSGNGWKNINSRARLLRAEVSIDSVLGRPGTTFILDIDSKKQVATSTR